MSETALFWDRRSRKYDSRIRNHDAAYHELIARAQRHLKLTDVVLDFGCASGEITLDLAPFVQEIEGLDISGQMITLAQRKATQRSASNVSFRHGDLFDQALDDSRRFTAAVAFNVLHLVPRPAEVVARLNELLPQGGLLVSETPCLAEWPWLKRALLGVGQSTRYAPVVHRFKYADLEKIIAAAGFEISESTVHDRLHFSRWIIARKR